LGGNLLSSISDSEFIGLRLRLAVEDRYLSPRKEGEQPHAPWGIRKTPRRKVWKSLFSSKGRSGRLLLASKGGFVGKKTSEGVNVASTSAEGPVEFLKHRFRRPGRKKRGRGLAIEKSGKRIRRKLAGGPNRTPPLGRRMYVLNIVGGHSS